MSPVMILVILSPLLLFLAIWLNKNRNNKTILYYGALFTLIMPFWLLIGLIYALGPWHDLRVGLFRFAGYILAGPVYLYELIFGFSAPFLTIILYTVAGGFIFGLVAGGVIKAFFFLFNLRDKG